MKKSILLLALAAGVSLGMNAGSKVYTFDSLGEIDGISDNGRYGVVTDPDNGLAYIWDSTNPETLKDITARTESAGNFTYNGDIWTTTAMDVSDDGIVVGSVLLGATYNPAYYKDGKWNLLPLDPNAKNTNEAVCITPDGKIIAGYHFVNDPTSDTGGRYYPCQWFLGDDGYYSLKSYTNIELPDHQGFFPMTQSPDGEIIAGSVYCGFQSNVNAIVKNGELILFDKIETINEPWFFGGKYFAGWAEDGKTQIWVSDINDPRVVYFPEVYINGYKDKGDEGALIGFFTNCDGNGNLYGARSRVINLTDEGEGEVVTEACIYNYKTDTWYTDEDYGFFSAGIGHDLLFTNTGEMINGETITSVPDAFDINTTGDVEGINKISADASVLGGVSSEYSEAIGGLMYFPFFVKTEGYSGVQAVVGTPEKGLVITSPGRIEVLNAEDIAVYDLDGRLIGKEKVTLVNPGVYVVRAGNSVHKVMVR
ncbi:MAG: hypothetical protein K2H96_10510 [Muribaculaceae bacterium]|nr:hypothetical protein [Muribaculaceae bacterium]